MADDYSVNDTKIDNNEIISREIGNNSNNSNNGIYGIVENIEQVLANVKEACKRANRSPDSVKLVAVSKTKPNDMLYEAYNTGIREFGENYVQELCAKIDTMPKDINWHMIGHLQRNKVKYIVGRVAMIHSVDSLRLAEEISKEALKKGCVVDILVEVNVAEENSKFGITVENAPEVMEEMAKLPGIKIKGLMTSAPYVTEPEDNRVFFQKLRKLAVDIKSKNIDNINVDELSMGMTNDYTVAVEEGATIIRVGTAIFGERNYNK